MQEPQLKTVHVNGARLAYFERGTRREDAPTLLFVHATGFHGRLWDYQAEAFPDHHIIALEQRGHGRSESLAATDWQVFGEDQAAFVQTLGLTDLIGIAHSMGAHGMVDAAARSGAFSRLLLLDPTIASPEAYQQSFESYWGEGMHPAAKRRHRFESVQDMMDRLAGKSSFPMFHPRIFRDYCEHGLLQQEDGGYVLACAPEVEAHVYMYSRTNGEIFDRIRSIDIPVTIVRARLPTPDAGHDFSSSPTWPGLVDEFVNGVELFWPDCSHFIPMQRPDDVISLINEEIDAWRN